MVFDFRFSVDIFRIFSMLPFISGYNNSQDITPHTQKETATNKLLTILGLLNHAAIHKARYNVSNSIFGNKSK